jgi:hypothetical protein
VARLPGERHRRWWIQIARISVIIGRREAPVASSELVGFEVQQAELTYSAVLDPPAFELAARWIDMQSAMHSGLSAFNLRLADIKIESTSSNPADLSIACWLLPISTVVRYHLDRVEVWSNNFRLLTDKVLCGDLVDHAIQVVRTVSPDASFALYRMAVGLHGILSGRTVVSVLANYVTKTPPGTPQWAANGVGFARRLPSDDGQGSIVFEPSAVTKDGGFLRTMSEHSGALSEREALAHAMDFLESSVTELGFRLSGGE